MQKVIFIGSLKYSDVLQLVKFQFNNLFYENLTTNCGMNTFKNQLHIFVSSPQGTMMLERNVDTDGGIRVNTILPGTSGLQVQVK